MKISFPAARVEVRSFYGSMGSSSATIQHREPFHRLELQSQMSGPLISWVDVSFHRAKTHLKLLAAK